MTRQRPLVVMDDGQWCLRDTTLPPSILRNYLDTGHTLDQIRYDYRLLRDWTDAELLEAATFPNCQTRRPLGEEAVMEIAYDGDVQLDGWIYPAEIPAVIAALQQAAQLVTDWRAACLRWGEEHGDSIEQDRTP